jgi:hypothetical protein
MGYCIVSVNVCKVTHGNHPHLSANPNRIVPGESKLGFVVDFDGLRIESMNTNYSVKMLHILVRLFYRPTPHSTASTGYCPQYQNL